MALKLLDGSEAIVEAAILAGARMYAGYPMSPATELVENMARKMPESGGVCINAATEIEGINIAMGAAATGFRAATGSCGQGLALMQEAIAEAALNETPIVIFNMARNQQARDAIPSTDAETSVESTNDDLLDPAVKELLVQYDRDLFQS